MIITNIDQCSMETRSNKCEVAHAGRILTKKVLYVLPVWQDARSSQMPAKTVRYCYGR